ncbi:hypothetical protein ZJ30_01690 [Salmonella enterica subsp. enterica serovar Typhimurium]|uniref:Uncharacterized protein n=1 Tax=Salmonella typhimurium TaxID=90371 RepID=A0A3Y9EUX6_SALTM|nr:hypothetical protein [Salmonella enterica]EAB8512313.1 hypothetical protein [Salmonella enterica subsp. enterica serovar Typhimurium]EAC0790943.1 hypothetical protein [Salmonella enterica subsp. enterica serovar Typhimurium]EBF8517102.1 hypothetical protein [Salmonella enterica subsp. enterica serovar Typhimurium]EBU6463856.1 hypothetical protein [Salmonella enterica subsp. enterica serovar Typhimurium]EBU7090848.1 hypothetical protein [Salmonella enterica subsp. enterica serovar Typhimuriu
MNHVKKHVLWKDEYFERYYRLNPELVQKRLDKIYQAEDDLMVLISTQLFCFLQANGTLYSANCPDFSQWQRPEWFNPLVDFLAQRRPELAFLRHLFI